jgi:hypothetical protein
MAAATARIEFGIRGLVLADRGLKSRIWFILIKLANSHLLNII